MQKTFQDISGKKFNSLTVISVARRTPGATMWLCQCDCGKFVERALCAIKTGKTKSCGCLNGAAITAGKTRHGHSIKGKMTAEYRIWSNMRNRCSNPNNPSYYRYGGRGIKVCDRWLESFENFLADVGQRPSKKHSLDRKDNDGPYSPENCRWATAKEQANNRTSSRFVTINGETKTVAQWADTTGIGMNTINYRLNRGWPLEHLFAPVIQSKVTPEKLRARQAIAYEVQSKRIPSARTLTCVQCSGKHCDYHHHLGYDREHWLDVIPLCKRCHELADHVGVQK